MGEKIFIIILLKSDAYTNTWKLFILHICFHAARVSNILVQNIFFSSFKDSLSLHKKLVVSSSKFNLISIQLRPILNRVPKIIESILSRANFLSRYLLIFSKATRINNSYLLGNYHRSMVIYKWTRSRENSRGAINDMRIFRDNCEQATVTKALGSRACFVRTSVTFREVQERKKRKNNSLT